MGKEGGDFKKEFRRFVFCMLMLFIQYKNIRLSLFHFVLLGVLILDGIFSSAAFSRWWKTHKPGKSFSNWLSRKRHLLNPKSFSSWLSRKRHLLNPKSFSNWLSRKRHSLNPNGTYPEIGRYGKQRLFVSTKEIAKGSNETGIFEGEFQGRKVAVKRLRKALHNLAFKEVDILIKSDHHPNIVRYHCINVDNDYVYLALEHCICSLTDLILLQAGALQNSDYTGHHQAINMQNINLWESHGYPSALLIKLMRDMVDGLVHLHELGIIHQDIKPQNVMIANGKGLCAKLSDIGINKWLPSDMSSLSQKYATGSGSSGWQASEQTQAVDMFSLGCVFLFCLSRGVYPFDDEDINTVNSRISFYLSKNRPEAVDLLSRLLDPDPQMRPTAFHVSYHPLFWDSVTRLSFLCLVSDRLQSEVQNPPSNFLKDVERVGTRIFGKRGWHKKMQQELLDDIHQYRDYRHKSVQHLLRVVRNKLNHYYESPQEIQVLLGSKPEGFDNYFITRFPRLLIEVYKVIKRYCRSEESFSKYFEPDSVPSV